MVLNFPTTPHHLPGGGGVAGLSPEVSDTPLENSTSLKNPPSPLPNVPNDPDSDPDTNSSDSSSSDSSDPSKSRDIKRKNFTRKKCRSKNCMSKPIEQCTNLISKILKAAYYLNFTKFKLYEYSL